MTYQGDDGSPTGVLCEIFAIAAKYLEDQGYVIKYIPTSSDDLNLGLASGDYDIGLFNAAYTKARAETYVFPSEYYGASKMVAVVRTADADANSPEKIVNKGLSASPVGPNNGIAFALERWNEFNTDKQIKLTYQDDSAADTGIEDVANGKYGVSFTLAAFWDAKVVAEDGVYHRYKENSPVILCWP